MSEEIEGAANGPEGGGAGGDPAAMAMALGGASRGKADAFLEKQGHLADEQIALTRLQAKELAHELKLRHWSLQLRHASAILKFALEISLAAVAIAFACFIGAVVWNAARAGGLIVESFTVPPDLAARGLTGQAIAGRLTDKLSEMQSSTSSIRAARSYTNNWGNDIKVEIPETGVSVGEAYSFLKSWLGHETHVSGDVWRAQSGVTIVARVGDGSSVTVSGTEADLDNLIQKAAEDIYNRTQPYRYGVYLRQQGRVDESIARFKSLAATGNQAERGWAFSGLTNVLLTSVTAAEHERLLKRAEMNGSISAIGNLALLESNRGRPELAMAYYEKAEDTLRQRGGDIEPKQIPILINVYEASKLALLGDFQSAVSLNSITTGTLGSPSYTIARFQILDHDLTAARETLDNPLPVPGGAIPGNDAIARLFADMLMAQETGNWKPVLDSARAMIPIFQKYPGLASINPTQYEPLAAIAEARLGKFADAQRRVSVMPHDCYQCMMARAQVEQMQSQQARADFWFARAVQSNPSIPMAYADWGQSLLARGKPDEAIAKFTLANQKGPKFADPLEMWGQALMAKNQSHLALAKFAEAEKYAPNWGRLHLKWGEALVYAGKKDEAKAQFARAAALDLTAADMAELAKVSGHV